MTTTAFSLQANSADNDLGVDRSGIELRLKALFFQSARRMALPGMALWLTLGWITRFDLPGHQVWPWALAGAAVFLVRTAVVRRFTNGPESQWPVAALSHFVLGCAVCQGVLASAGALLIFPHLSADRQALMTMIYVGWFAGGIGVNGTYPQWFHVWALPLMSSLILAWAWRATGPALAMALLLTLLGYMLLSTLSDYTAQIVRSLQLQAQLTSRSVELERALSLKASFMAATSHDLRQPVMSLGLLNYALQSACANEASRTLARRMSAPIEALQTMLNSLMEISQLESNALKVVRTEFSLLGLCQSLADEYRAQLASRPVELRCHCDQSILRADRTLIERIIRNLLSNAVKFTHQGLIRLEARVSAGQLRIRVMDTGIGIAPKDQRRVFGDYCQAEQAAPTGDQGLGLGLAIVERITSLLGGRVELESEPGRGSTFVVSLPVEALATVDTAARAAGPLPRSEPSERSGSSAGSRTQGAARMAAEPTTPETGLNRPDDDPGPVAASAPGPQASDIPTLSGLWIQVVDDDRLMRDSLRLLLTMNGAQVSIAQNDIQALTANRDSGDTMQQPGTPDLVIIDYQLGTGRNGLELLAAMRHDRPELHAILLTGTIDPKLQAQAEAAGARLLLKPVHPERLLREIEKVRRPRTDATTPRPEPDHA